MIFLFKKLEMSLAEFLYYRWDESYEETCDFKHVSHYSPHSFLIIFKNVAYSDEVRLFRYFYSRLTISAKMIKLYQFHLEKFHFYAHSPPLRIEDFKSDFLRSRWNIDEIILSSNTQGVKDYLNYNGHFPISIQRDNDKFKMNNISDILPVHYNIYSGYYQKCIHNSTYEKLQHLTYDFNAYDRLFCDAFEYHGLLEGSVATHYDLGDIYYLRHSLLRDGLLALFPPDSANVVYYASPKRMFIVLKSSPETWKFIIRPFTKFAWIFLLVIAATLAVAHHIRQFLNWICQDNMEVEACKGAVVAPFGGFESQSAADKFEKYESMHEHYLNLVTGIFRVLITSAYGGMILVGILKPLYPWTPSTFAELNRTKNYFIGIPGHSPPFLLEQLIQDHVINGIKKVMIRNRDSDTPSEFLANALASSPDGNDFKPHAIIMFDDKMNFWVKGRRFIETTAPFLKKVKIASEAILPETRYVSVAPGATRLHFLVKTMKRVYTSGTWLRWWKLEENYYKLVAPLVAATKIKEQGLREYPDDHELRPLALHDMFSVFGIFGAFVTFAVGMFLAENTWLAHECVRTSRPRI